MRAALRGAMALVGATCLVGTYLAVPMAANAAGTGPVAFSNAKFSGYASGDELHTNALTLGTTKVLDVEQAFSGATTNSAGLTSTFNDPSPAATNIGTPIQPAQAPTVKAYGMGSGLELGVATSSSAASDVNQFDISGKAQSIAPPISPAVTKTISVPAALKPLIMGDSLKGRSDALFDPNVCPLGQPISYGLGQASNVSLLNSVAGVPAVVNTSGSIPAETATTTSYTYVNANKDGSFGLGSTATETVAPISVVLPNNLGQLSITLSGSQDGTAPANPVTLKTVSTGEGSSSVTLTNDNFLTVSLTLAGVTTVLVPPSLLGPLVAPRTVSLGTLGSITINTLNQSSAGNAVTADYTLFGIDLNVGGLLPVVNLESGHMVAGDNVANSFTCTIPLVKIAQPSSITAGNSFTYFIEVPDPAKLDLLACSLVNLKVVDTISDVPSKGQPTFSVVSAKPNGTIAQTSPSNAVVTFTGLTYTVAPPGKPINPPLLLAITVAVPASSPAGTIQDFANASAVASGCNGGITGSGNVGGVNGTPLGGTFHLQAPTVKAAAVTPAAGSQPAAGAAGQPGELPRTGGQGGLWQPGLGVGLLALAGGAFALLRRSRRRLSGS